MVAANHFLVHIRLWTHYVHAHPQHICQEKILVALMKCAYFWND
jgi:hypothetical protein